jgi:hypothetical protein
MTARDHLDLARLRREPTHVIARLEHAVALHAAGDPDALLTRVLATDNPHGEPPPNPCPTCGRVKETK